MKKTRLMTLSLVCAVCVCFGVLMTLGTKTAYAETIVQGTNPTLSTTIFNVSNADDEGNRAMLLATAIKNYEHVYENGYVVTATKGGEEYSVTYYKKETSKFYTSIRSGEKEWTTEDLFGETYAEAGMIVWELAYDEDVDYTIQPYALVGYLVDGEFLKPTDDKDVIRVDGYENVISQHYSLSFDGAVSAVADMDVTIGEALTGLPAVPEKTGYTGVWMLDGNQITSATTWRWYKDKTASALYTPNTYELTIGGETRNVTYGQTVGTLPDISEQTGYTVDGWYIGDTKITSATVWAYTEDKTASALYTPNTYKLTIGGETLNVKYNSPIPSLPSIPSDTLEKKYKGMWQVDGDIIEAGDIWTIASDKTASAPYWTIVDNSLYWAADFSRASNDSYTIGKAAIDESLTDIDHVTDVKCNDVTLTYTKDSSSDEIVFGNAYIKGYANGDYNVEVYTENYVYYIKVAVVTKEISSYSDLTSLAVTAADGSGHYILDGYYVLTADIDASASSASPLRLIKNSDATRPGTDTESGFAGVFDGRGHVIKNLTVPRSYNAFSGLFGQLLPSSVVRNVAFTNMIGEDTAGTNKDGYPLLIGESAKFQGTVKDVVVTTNSNARLLWDMRYKSGTVDGTIDNLVFIAPNAPELCFGNSGTAITNTLNVMMWPTTHRGINNSGAVRWDDIASIKPYYTANQALAALSADNYISDWSSPYIRYNSTNNVITFNGSAVVRRSVDIEIGSAISISGISDPVTHIQVEGGTKIAITDNKVSKANLNSAAGVDYSEGLVTTFFTASGEYTLNAAFATKIIHNYTEFSSLAKKSSTLDGYYVIANSFEANNETPMERWTAYSSTQTTGFIGILDGRGHVISNLKVNDRFMGGVGRCVIKNIAFVNFTQATAGHPMFGETHGATFSNVFVSSSTSTCMIDTIWENPTLRDIVYITSAAQLDYGVNHSGGTGTYTIKNIIAVANDNANYPYGHGYFGGTINRTNATKYLSRGAFLTALPNIPFGNWASMFMRVGNDLKFYGTTVISAS